MKTAYFKQIQIIAFLLLLYCSIPLGYSGEKQLYLFGGGGGPDGDNTIFDDELNLISQFANSPKSAWKTNYTFNGGHSETEKILQTKFKNATSFGRFSKKNFLNSLQDIEGKLKDLKRGDQLLLIMNTHGLNNTSDEKTHSIITSPVDGESYKSAEGARFASMDEFEKITALAEEKGVKLALIDLSCYSGNTLRLRKKNICIITTTGENQLGYSDNLGTPKNKLMTFEGRFLNGMRKGENLENLFLNSRKDSHFQDFPMISTDAGILMNDLIFKILEPYLVFNIQKKYDFSERYDSKNIPEALCKTQNEFSEIKKRLKEISELYSIPLSFIETSKLEKTLNAYRAYQLEFEKIYSESQIAGNEVKEIIHRDFPEQAALFDDEEGNAILTLTASREKSMKILKDVMANDKTSSFASIYQESYEKLAQKNKICKEISSKVSPASKAIMNKFAKLYIHSNKTEILVNDVASAAKLFYDKLYRTQELNSLENNPCKDFIL
ncbi:MAG: hypothetical protein PHY93_17540 [Bacteriovorax sp.]|nr:hypothetical protein [Bacteriovorax sp.]